MTSVPLGDLIRPAATRRAGTGSDLPLLSMTMHDGLVDQSHKFKKRVASADVSQYKIVTLGQLVVGFPIDEGVLSFQNLYPEALVSPAYGVWEIKDPERVSEEYLQRFLKSPLAMSYYAGKLRGSTARRRSLPSEVFLALSVPLPDISEQRRISAILNHADLLRSKQRSLVSTLSKFQSALFATKFTNITETKPLADLVEEFRYGTSSKSDTHGHPTLRIPNILSGSIDTTDLKLVPSDSKETERLRLKDGDLLFVRTNGNRDNIGRCAVFHPEGVLQGTWIYASYLIRARLKGNVHADYLASFFESFLGRRELTKRASTSAGQFNINIESLKSIPVPVPSIDEQISFVKSLNEIKLQLSSVLERQNLLDELFGSLQVLAFRGEL